ncbi:MAG: hypothetical protein JW909_09720 [Planctomycetes bacterium]|nr:hypothetical protein [Planctomycetota bacterium]
MRKLHAVASVCMISVFLAGWAGCSKPPRPAPTPQPVPPSAPVATVAPDNPQAPADGIPDDLEKQGVVIDVRPGTVFAADKTVFGTEDAGGQGGESSTVIQDFEKDIPLNPWPDTGRLEFSSDWKKDGARSLRIYGGTMFAFHEMTSTDWSSYQVLRFHTYVPGTSGVVMGVEITDNHTSYHNRHQNNASAPAGEGVVDIDIGGKLWRGEINRPYRDVKTPIDTSSITRLALSAAGGDVFVDRVELVMVRQIKTDGGFAFDFGRKGQMGQSQYIEVNEDTVYDDDKGFGFDRAGAWGLGKVTPYPSPMMGNGLDFRGRRFRVRLPGGPYTGWIVFERSGFWGGEQAVYEKARLAVNGATVHQHEQSADTPYFAFQDLEILTQEQVVDMVMARQKTADFSFRALAGVNEFEISTEGVKGLNLRVAGIVMAPDTAAGRDFVKAHKHLQRAAILQAHRVIDKSDRRSDPAGAATPLLVLPLSSDYTMRPGDRPAETVSKPVPALHSYAGLNAVRLIGLYASGEMELDAATSPLKGPAGEIPAAAVRLLVNNYMPMRDYETTAPAIETLYYRPMDGSLWLSDKVARTMLISIDVPDDAAPGRYRGVLELTGFQKGILAEEPPLRARVLVELVVHKGRLPQVDFPNSLFMSGVAVPQNLISDDDFWRLSEDVIRMLSRAGKTFLTKGPNFQVDWQQDKAVVSGDDVVRMIRIAERYGMAQAISNYGGFDMPLRRLPERPGMSPQQVADAMFAAFEKFRRDNNLPQYYYYSYDEPGTPEDFAPVKALLPVLRSAGFKTIGYTSMNDPDSADENHRFLAEQTTNPSFNLHSPKTLEYVRGLGNEPWVYNNGLGRYHQGVHLWRNHRCGAGGRCDWITAIIQGFQFDTLDSREPDKSCMYFHRKTGVLVSPRFMGVIEGGLDARLLFQLGKKAASTSPVSAKIQALFKELDAGPYRDPAMSWEELEDLRTRMIRLLDEAS